MQQTALDTHGRIQIQQPVLQRNHLVQPFDIAPGDRQESQLDASFERIGRKPLPTADESHRKEQRAGEDRIRQRVGRIMKSSTIPIERRHGAAK